MKDKIIEKFGDQAFSYGAFYKNPESLRFELSEGGSFAEMLVTAYNKAREITGEVFQDCKSLYVCLSFFGEGSFIANRRIFRQIEECQLKLPRGQVESWEEFDDAEEITMKFLLFPFQVEELSKLLWGALATDLGINPKLYCNVHLVNFDLGVIVYPYDDRGMDVIGPNKQYLKGLYNKYHRYLLDYDMEEMSRCFGDI